MPQPTSTESENIDPKFAYDTSEIPSFDISFYLDTDYENIDPRKFGKSIDLSKTYSSALTPEQIRTLLADADNEDDDVKSKGKGKGKGSDSAKQFQNVLAIMLQLGKLLVNRILHSKTSLSILSKTTTKLLDTIDLLKVRKLHLKILILSLYYIPLWILLES